MRLMAIAAALFLAGCSNDYEAQQESLHKHLQGNRIGSSADVYLVKLNSLGNWERVAVFFGFADDMQGCEEFARAYAKEYPANEYRCMIAN